MPSTSQYAYSFVFAHFDELQRLPATQFLFSESGISWSLFKRLIDRGLIKKVGLRSVRSGPKGYSGVVGVWEPTDAFFETMQRVRDRRARNSLDAKQNIACVDECGGDR